MAGVNMADHGSAPSGQAAVLSATLGGTGSTATGSSASSTPAGKGAARRVAGILRHLRGLHGEFTVRAAGGKFRELAFERGVIVAANSTNVTVRAADGTTWTWTFAANSVVRKDGAKSSAASLATGDRVFVGGQEQGSVRDVRLIIVPKKAAASQSGSASTGTSSSSPSSS